MKAPLPTARIHLLSKTTSHGQNDKTADTQAERRLLAINALFDAARAGEAGRAGARAIIHDGELDLATRRKLARLMAH